MVTEAQVDLGKLQLDHIDEQRRPRRWPWVLLLLLVAAIVVAFLYRDRFLPGLLRGLDPGADRPAVRVARVTMDRAGGFGSGGAVSAGGWVKLPRYHPVLVTPLVEGRLEELFVLEGDRVKKGQVIARLYAKDYEATLAAAEAALGVAQANHARLAAGSRPQEIAAARAEVKRIEAELETARIILAQSKKLHPIGGVSDEVLARDDRAVKTNAAMLVQAREKLDLRVVGYRKEDIALGAAAAAKAAAERDLAKLRLGYTKIVSPIDGVVLERSASPGQWLEPKRSSVVSLYDPADLEARIDVDQDAIAKIRVGQSVTLSTRAESGVSQPGRVVVIEPKADEVKNIVPVRVKFLKPEGRLLYPDMVVKARFEPTKGDRSAQSPTRPAPRPMIPDSAVVEREGQRYVYVLNGERVKRVAVTLGAAVGGRYPVTDGLAGGERIVVSGQEKLADGAAVSVIE